MADEQFPGLPYAAERIIKFFYNLNFFMLKLDDGQLVSYTAIDKERFLTWLKENRIPCIGDAEN